jgi:hypothetical protein
MDDQQENVIDGTARARQWRLASSKTRGATDGAEARSDAPKSIAGSLLVPADMLSAPFPGDGHVNRNEQSRATEAPPRPGAVTAGKASDDDTPHQNPFLVPEAAGDTSAGRDTRPARRQLIVAPLTRSVGAIYARRKSPRAPWALEAMHRQRLGALRLSGLFAIAVAAAAIALTAVILTQSETAHPPLPEAFRAGGRASPFNPLESGPFAARTNPFDQRRPSRDQASHRAPRIRAPRPNKMHPRPRPPSKAAAVTARYTPPASTGGSSAPASDTPSYASSGSTAPSGQPATTGGGGGTTSSTRSTSSRPAFGQNGTLGPGHSPNS